MILSIFVLNVFEDCTVDNKIQLDNQNFVYNCLKTDKWSGNSDDFLNLLDFLSTSRM